jgi:excisionase family DNA binding protein
VSVTEAARRLNIDRHTLYDAAARGEVPARRIGRSVRVPAWWVDAGGPSDNGRTAPADAPAFAAEFARAVAVELARLLGEAAGRATAADRSATVHDLRHARDDVVGGHGAG